MDPVNDSGIKNFFKNFWQPWQAPKGERTAPIIGFIAATVLFLPLFLPAVGIAALAKAVKHVKDSSSGVQVTAVRVDSLVGKNAPLVLPEVTTPEQRESYLDSVRAKKEEFQDFLDGLEVDEQYLEVKEEYKKSSNDLVEDTELKLQGLGNIIDDLEKNIGKTKKFNEFMKEAESQIETLEKFKKSIEEGVKKEIAEKYGAELCTPSTPAEREELLKNIYAKKEEFQAFLDELTPTEEGYLKEETKMFTLWDGFIEIVEELENSMNDSEQFNRLTRKLGSQMILLGFCVDALNKWKQEANIGSDEASISSEGSIEGGSELDTSTLEEREKILEPVRARKNEFQAFLDRLDVSEEYEKKTKDSIAYVRKQNIWLEELLTNLESHIEDSEKFNEFMRDAESQINALQANINKIKQDLIDPKYKGLISLKDVSRTDSNLDERRKSIDSVRAKKEEFQAFLEKASKEDNKENHDFIKQAREQLDFLGEILSDLESNIKDSKGFNFFMKQAEDQIEWFNLKRRG